MVERFVFRQVDYRDIQTFLDDGEVRAKDHYNPQLCHQTSYRDIVDRRGTTLFNMPCGGVVNDYVPFYFSPKTSFTYAIHLGNVVVRDPDGNNLGTSCSDDRIFLVGRVSNFQAQDLQYCYSNVPLNSGEGLAVLREDLSELEEHVNWDVFDDEPLTGRIPEIGYTGVCSYFMNSHNARYLNRSKQRMAEFLVRESVPLEMMECIITNSDAISANIQSKIALSKYNIPIHTKTGCYF